MDFSAGHRFSSSIADYTLDANVRLQHSAQPPYLLVCQHTADPGISPRPISAAVVLRGAVWGLKGPCEGRNMLLPTLKPLPLHVATGTLPRKEYRSMKAARTCRSLANQNCAASSAMKEGKLIYEVNLLPHCCVCGKGISTGNFLRLQTCAAPLNNIVIPGKSATRS